MSSAHAWSMGSAARGKLDSNGKLVPGPGQYSPAKENGAKTKSPPKYSYREYLNIIRLIGLEKACAAAWRLRW